MSVEKLPCCCVCSEVVTEIKDSDLYYCERDGFLYPEDVIYLLCEVEDEAN